MSRKWKVYPYAMDEVEDFQRAVIDLANALRNNLRFLDHNEEYFELHNIANTLEELAYNEVDLSVRQDYNTEPRPFVAPNGF